MADKASSVKDVPVINKVNIESDYWMVACKNKFDFKIKRNQNKIYTNSITELHIINQKQIAGFVERRNGDDK